MPAKIFRGGVPYGGGGAASDSGVQAVRCGDDIYTPVEGTVNLPDFTTINDATASDSSVYSSNKTNVLLGAKADKSETAEYPIASTTTGINSSITDSADGYVQDVTVYGRSVVDEGDIISVGDSGELDVQTCGKNLFDKTAKDPDNGYMDNKYLDASTGTVDASDYFYITEYIKINPQTNYILSNAIGNLPSLFLYDINKSYISGVSYANNTPITFNSGNAHYIRFSVYKTNESITQLELSSAPTAYEPYISSTASLTTGLPLCGIPVTSGETYTDGDGVKWLADTADVEGVTKRCGVVDLGDYEWTHVEYDGNVHKFFSNTSLPNVGIHLNGIDGICPNYQIYQGNQLNMPDKSITIANNTVSANALIAIRDDNYTDATAFKTAVTGVKLVYPLDTTTTTPLTPAEKSALLSLKTFDSTTNVTVTDDPFVDISYIKNTANGKAAEQLADNLRASIGWIFAVPEMHRNILRGKYLGSSVTAAQLAAIADGSFDDLYVKDYWTINNTVYRIADMDFFRTDANSPFLFTTHHLVIVPDGTMYKAKMNDSSATTSGGYKNSDMRTTNLATAKATINTDFPNMVLTYKDLLVTATSSGTPTASDYFDCDIELMSETMLFGGYVNAKPSNPPYFCASTNPTQFALFKLNPQFIITDKSDTIWLRDAADGSRFCTMEYSPFGRDANSTYGAVRPFFLIGDASNV